MKDAAFAAEEGVTPFTQPVIYFDAACQPGLYSVTFAPGADTKDFMARRRAWRAKNPDAPYGRMDLIADLWQR